MSRSLDGRWTRICEVCGDDFQQRRPGQRTCSLPKPCRARLPRNTGGLRAKAGLASQTCQNPECGKQFQPVRERQVACSRACLLKCPSYVTSQHKSDRRPERRERQNELRRQATTNDQDRIWAKNFRANHGRKTKMTPEQYLAKHEAQQGLCMICNQLPRGKGGRGSAIPRLYADHDHETGEMRDLLCGPCNQGLGCFQEDPVLLRAAAEYIERHRLALT